MISDKNNDEEILIVEDSPTQAEELKFLLDKYHYQVSVAYNGREALEMINKRKPAIVISDIVMPEMDGYELCRQIKGNGNLKDIPVILLTVLSDPKDLIRGLEVGADNFFTKPYDEGYLIARVKYLLANKTLRSREKMEMGIKIVFGGQEYYITSERQQILNLLLSTYETAVQKNIELQKTQDELKILNEQLEMKVEERTASLRAEMDVRRHAEEDLCNVNRALKTLSGVNKALVRSTDESELFHSVCRITVEIGGYRQAWIGLVEQDEMKTVRPAAQYGYEEAYLETFNSTAGDKKNPALSEAIRTGKPSIVKNILTDPNHGQCTSEAVRRGYASCIAIPFNADNQLSGVLNIFAKEPDAFDDDEVKLLAEMAEDLAFGVTALHISEKHRIAKEALQQSEEKYRALMDNASDAIILMDMQGNLLEINRKTESLLSYSNQEVFNKPFSRFILKNDLDRTIAAFEDLIRTGSSVLSEVNLLKKDGTPVPVDITGSIIQYGDKKVAQVIFRDITERKKAEATLRESEERYRRLVEFSPYGIAIHSEGKIVYMNQGGAKILGTENPDEIIGKPVLDIIHPDYHEIARQRIRMEEEGNVAPLLDEKFLRIDGTPVDVEIIAIPFTHKGKPSMYGVFRDITERKQAEEIQRKLSSAVEHTADIVVIAKKDGTIEYVNPAFEKITGYTLEEAVGKTPRILKSGKQDLKFYEHLWGTILAGEVFYGVLINKKNNGELYYTEKTITPVKDEQGTITHFVSTDKDITESKKAEEIYRENLRLEAADKAKSEFLANMSHELRTPLNATIGFSELLKQGTAGELSEKQKHFVDNILSSGKHLLNLINDILDLSKVEAGKIELVIEKIPLSETINETLILINEKAAKHNVILNRELDPQLVHIEADKLRVKQVLFNLLDNAVKFSKPGGGTVTITTKKEGDMAKISVSDTGIGIKEKDMNKVFQKFMQINPPGKYKGTGLGLPISKQLVELQGGKIMVESRFGEGSTFTFLLPIKSKKSGDT